MRSTLILIAHLAMYGVVFAASVISSYVMMYNPSLILSISTLGVIGMTLYVCQKVWTRYNGQCPCTYYENLWRHFDMKPRYRKSCTEHYCLEWFNIRLPKGADNWIIGILFGLPATITGVTLITELIP